jgi:hypothetical protein
MIVTGQQLASWGVGIVGQTIANIITFLLFTAVTGTWWFKILIKKVQEDLNKIDKKDAPKESAS